MPLGPVGGDRRYHEKQWHGCPFLLKLGESIRGNCYFACLITEATSIAPRLGSRQSIALWDILDRHPLYFRWLEQPEMPQKSAMRQIHSNE